MQLMLVAKSYQQGKSHIGVSITLQLNIQRATSSLISLICFREDKREFSIHQIGDWLRLIERQKRANNQFSFSQVLFRFKQEKNFRKLIRECQKKSWKPEKCLEAFFPSYDVTAGSCDDWQHFCKKALLDVIDVFQNV